MANYLVDSDRANHKNEYKIIVFLLTTTMMGLYIKIY